MLHQKRPYTGMPFISEFLWLVLKKEIADFTKRQLRIFMEAIQPQGEFIENASCQSDKKKNRRI